MAFITRIDNNQEITIHYEVTGQGEPIVFHHGNGNSCANWKDLGYVEALAQYFQLIMLDSRGYGKSSKPHDPKAYSLKSRVDDTIAVLDALNIDKAHCFGGSIGASICMLLAKHYPDRFNSYILATPYFELFGDKFKAPLRIGSQKFLDTLECVLGEKLENEAIRNTMLKNDHLALLAANSSEWFNYHDYIQYLKKPTLIYCGEKEPTLQQMINLSKQIANSELEIIPNFTHKDAYWNGEVVSKIIHKFLKSL
mgnify:CR=1 FL=1